MRHRHSSNGFTLIETLFALTLAAVAIPVLVSVYVNTLHALRSLTTETTRNAEIRFVRTQVIREPNLKEFEKGGEIELLNGGVASWEAEVEPTETADLFETTLFIELPTERIGDTYRHEETILLLRPTWSDPAERSKIIADKRDGLTEQRMDNGWTFSQ